MCTARGLPGIFTRIAKEKPPDFAGGFLVGTLVVRVPPGGHAQAESPVLGSHRLALGQLGGGVPFARHVAENANHFFPFRSVVFIV